MIHNVLLYGGTFAIVAMFAVIVGAFESQRAAAADPDQELRRETQELCQEVSTEVQHSVDSGLLSQAEADAIVERCYNLFVRRDQ